MGITSASKNASTLSDLPPHIQKVVKLLKELPRPKRMQGPDVFVPQRIRLKGKDVHPLMSKHFRTSTGELRLGSEFGQYPVEVLGFGKSLWDFFNGQVRTKHVASRTDRSTGLGMNQEKHDTEVELATASFTETAPGSADKIRRSIHRSSSTECLPTQVHITQCHRRRSSFANLRVPGHNIGPAACRLRTFLPRPC